MVFDIVCDCVLVVDWAAISKWVRRRVSHHARLVDVAGGATCLDSYDACRDWCYLGSCLHAMDAAARCLRHEDQRSERQAAGFELARGRADSAFALLDVFHGRLSVAVFESLARQH